MGNEHLEVFCFDSVDGKQNDYVIFMENYVKKQSIKGSPPLPWTLNLSEIFTEYVLDLG